MSVYVNPGVCLSGERVREARTRLGLTQTALADALRAAGENLGEPNQCCKRLVQQWEYGDIALPSPAYRRALEHVTGQEFASLCTTIVPVDWPTAAARVAQLATTVANLHAELSELHLSLMKHAELERESETTGKCELDEAAQTCQRD